MLNGEIMERYRLAKDWRSAGFYETENHRQIARAVRAGLGSGRLIAITGPIGVGKTVFLHRLQDDIASEKKVTVAESLSVDAARTTVPTLIAALFYDLSREKEVKIPTQGEKRERELRKLVVRSGKPVALFIDEAHDLYGRTLNGLKRLMEVVGRGGGNLSVVLIGHPKLRNDLRRPTMEEIGHRTDVLAFEGLGEDSAPTSTGCSASAPRTASRSIPSSSPRHWTSWRCA